MDVFLIANPASDGSTISKDGDLTLGNASFFPDHNGVFRVDDGDGTVYAYKSRNGDTLQNIFNVEHPDRSFSVDVGTADNIILNPFIELHSIGIVDFGSSIETKRETVYSVPLPTNVEERVRFHDTFEDKSNWEDSTLGSHKIETIGGDKALRVFTTSDIGTDKASLIKLDWSETNVDLKLAHYSSGYYLSYDAQVKVGFDPLPVPADYMAGLSFRQDAFETGNSYGISFLKGGSDDGIPDTLVPFNDRSMIALWQQTSGGNSTEWLAYKDVETPGALSDDVESGENLWSTDGVPAPDGLWHISTRRPHAGTSSWYYGQEATGTYNTGAANDGSLISTPINLCNATTASLNFWSWYFTENDPLYVNNYDRKFVDISSDYGTTWTRLFQLRTDNDPANPLGTWQQIPIDLSAYVGQSVQIRFYFETRDAVLNDHEGWYIDDVSITSDATFELNEATLLVRVVEAASIAFMSGSKGGGTERIKTDDKITGQTNGAKATVIGTPILASGSWDSDNAAGILLLHDATGTFSDGELLTVAGSAATAIAKDPMYLPSNPEPDPKRANYIRAYYANPSDCGTPNDAPLDDNKHGNPRNTDPANVNFYWPPDEITQDDDTWNWTAADDYFRLIQWDVVRVTGEVPVGDEVDTLKRISSDDEPGAIIESTESDLFTPDSGPFVQAEIGLHTFGNYSTTVYFDDFALQTEIFSTGGFLPAIQE
jgi:hypothetical protein